MIQILKYIQGTEWKPSGKNLSSGKSSSSTQESMRWKMTRIIQNQSPGLWCQSRNGSRLKATPTKCSLHRGFDTTGVLAWWPCWGPCLGTGSSCPASPPTSPPSPTPLWSPGTSSTSSTNRPKNWGRCHLTLTWRISWNFGLTDLAILLSILWGTWRTIRFGIWQNFKDFFCFLTLPCPPDFHMSFFYAVSYALGYIPKIVGIC